MTFASRALLLLREIRPDWLNPRDFQWEEFFYQLVAYRKTYGHCNVPPGWKVNRRLATWVASLKNAYKTGRRRLSKDRISRLEEIGFEWFPQNTRWFVRYRELLSFRKRFGHCNVTVYWTENASLGRWVFSQRRARKIGYLSKERVALLDKLGFQWDLWHSTFMDYYSQAKAFHDEHGHLSVPRRHKSLFHWVRRMRNDPPRLTIKQKRLLKNLGLWSAGRIAS